MYVSGPFDARLYALDASTGATIWTVASPYGWGEPALAGGILYATMAHGLGSCDLRALDAATGAGVWTIPGGPNVVSPRTRRSRTASSSMAPQAS